MNFLSYQKKKMNKYNQIPKLFVSSPSPKFPMEEVFDTAEEMVTTNYPPHRPLFSLCQSLTFLHALLKKEMCFCFDPRFITRLN